MKKFNLYFLIIICAFILVDLIPFGFHLSPLFSNGSPYYMLSLINITNIFISVGLGIVILLTLYYFFNQYEKDSILIKIFFFGYTLSITWTVSIQYFMMSNYEMTYLNSTKFGESLIKIFFNFISIMPIILVMITAISLIILILNNKKHIKNYLLILLFFVLIVLLKEFEIVIQAININRLIKNSNGFEFSKQITNFTLISKYLVFLLSIFLKATLVYEAINVYKELDNETENI